VSTITSSFYLTYNYYYTRSGPSRNDLTVCKGPGCGSRPLLLKLDFQLSV